LFDIYGNIKHDGKNSALER